MDVDTLAIDRDWNYGCSGATEGFPRRSISELFNGDRVARTQQCSRNERQCHLTAASDEHIVGADRQASHAGKHGSQRRAKRHVSFRIAVAKNVAATLRHDPAIGAADGLEGHQS
jgi:hypothetical protein